MKNLTNFQAVLAVLGENDQDVKDFRAIEKTGSKGHIYYYQACVLIVKAFNEGWIPNWNNSNEVKYFIYLNMKTGLFIGYDDWFSGSSVSARLAFKSRELCEFAGKNFNDYFYGYMKYEENTNVVASQKPLAFEKSINLEEKMVTKVVKNQNVKINGVERDLTVCVVYDGKILRGGYSVKLPTDKENTELAEKIALGRAMNPKTNLIYMEVGKGMDKKFIFHAVAEDLVRQIERGVIKIKGVK